MEIAAPTVVRLDRGYVRVEGPEAADFLERMLSNEVATLGVAEARQAFPADDEGPDRRASTVCRRRFCRRGHHGLSARFDAFPALLRRRRNLGVPESAPYQCRLELQQVEPQQEALSFQLFCRAL
jgi:hypothetical protein